jgi:hypothetical protein
MHRAKAKGRRKDVVHKLSAALMKEQGTIFIGNVNAADPARTRWRSRCGGTRSFEGGIAMNTPEQRTAAVLATRDFLKTLADGTTFEVPGAVRALATGLILAYPTPVDLLTSSLASPEIWALPEPSPETP